MDVIFVSINLFEDDVRVMVLDGLDLSRQEGFDAFVNNFTPVFSRPH